MVHFIMGWQIALVVTCEMLQFPRPFAMGWIFFLGWRIRFQPKSFCRVQNPKDFKGRASRCRLSWGFLAPLAYFAFSLCCKTPFYTLKKYEKYIYITEDI